MNFTLPDVSDEELLALEAQIQKAQSTRSLDGMKVFGFGEVSIAVGWPSDEPRFIGKRLAPLADVSLVDNALKEINIYIDHVQNSGYKVLPTETRHITRPDGMHVGYIVQPLVPKENLAETVLKTETPAVGHPLLVAVRDMVMNTGTERRFVDCQIPNFAWIDGELALLDLTSPATYGPNGETDYKLMPLSLHLFPYPLRGTTAKAVNELVGNYCGPRNNMTQICVHLHRIGAEAWVPAAIETFNEVLDEPIESAAVDEHWKQAKADFPKVKKLFLMQRAWQEKVRRKPYEYLLTDSFSGEVI